MQRVSRIALIVRPAQGFVDWFNRIRTGSSQVTVADLRADASVYLVAPDEEEMFDPAAIVDRYAEEIFEDQLWNRRHDRAVWPEDRSAQAFRAWFETECVLSVRDLDDDHVLVDEDIRPTADAALERCAWCLRMLADDEEPIPVTTLVVAEESLDIPPDAAVPWFVPNAEGVALATAPEEVLPGREGRSALTLWVCSPECAAALRDGLGRQVMPDGGEEKGEANRS